MKYSVKNIKDFKEQICPDCRANVFCIEKDNHWIASCPKFFNFMIEENKKQNN